MGVTHTRVISLLTTLSGRLGPTLGNLIWFNFNFLISSKISAFVGLTLSVAQMFNKITLTLHTLWVVEADVLQVTYNPTTLVDVFSLFLPVL